MGVAVRVHGLRGELAVDVHTDSPDARFAPGSVLRGRRVEGPDRTLTVEEANAAKEAAVAEAATRTGAVLR